MAKAAHGMKNLYLRHKEKIDYLLVGIWNTIFGYFSFVLLYYLFAHRVHYLLLLIISNIFSITNAYIGYKIFVFKTGGNYLREYLRFYTVYGSVLVVNIIFLPLIVSAFKVTPVVGQAVFMLLNMGVSYFAHKHFSFKKN